MSIVAAMGMAQGAIASDVSVDIHIGNQPRVVPVPVSAPVPPPPPVPVVIGEPPLFLYPSALRFGVAVGIPHDLFYISGVYYLFRGNIWYRSGYYNGPWVVTKYKSLPPGLRRHKFERIHYYRDEEYHRYQNEHDRYHGRKFRPGKERLKIEHKRMKEERKWDKKERGHGRHGGRY
jgi:hypothetical protein